MSAVAPEFSALPFAESDAKNKAQAEQQASSLVKARVHRRLFYRHWDSYLEDKRQHLFVLDVELASEWELKAGLPRDVTPGDRDAYPTSSTFSASPDFCFTPDSSHLIFTAVPAVDEAWSTNYDLCRVPITGGTTEWQTLTEANSAADGLPVFSPSGRQIAWRSQREPGYEADKWEIMLADCQPDGTLIGPPRSLTEKIDLSFDEIVWRDEQRMLTTAEFRGEKPVFGLSTEKPNVAEKAQGVGTFSNLSVSADGSVLVCNRSRMTAPPEVFAALLEPEILRTRLPGLDLSKANAELLAQLDLPEATSVEVPGQMVIRCKCGSCNHRGSTKPVAGRSRSLSTAVLRGRGRMDGVFAGILRSGLHRATWWLLLIPVEVLDSGRGTPTRSVGTGAADAMWT
ncbi:MAG UNVERIFIED_CONTAM: hypothetical protein LVR18_21240 [Planctomycetaceae bacterium]